MSWNSFIPTKIFSGLLQQPLIESEVFLKESYKNFFPTKDPPLSCFSYNEKFP